MAREDVDVRARYRFADALVSGVAVGEAALSAGYSRQQGWNLRNDPEFMAFVEKRRGELLGGSAVPAESDGAGPSTKAFQVVGTREDAALARKTLRSVANDEDAPAVARVAASKALIELARKPVVKTIPRVDAPVLKVLPAAQDDGEAAKKWLEAQ